MTLVIDQLVRYLAASVFFAACAVGLTHWLVRTGKITPFGAWARFVRRISDPVLQPIERRLLRSGGNPQDAAWVLVLVALVGALVLVYLMSWLIRTVQSLMYAGELGPRALLLWVFSGVFNILIWSLFIRVIGSWLGMGEYSKWMRPFYFLTEWLVAPLRRVLPPLGPFDMSPFVAALVLIVTRYAVFSLILRL